MIANTILTAVYLLGCGLFRATTPYPVILFALLIGGLSRSIEFTAIQSLGYAEMPVGLMGRATSFASMSQQIWLSFGVGLVALVVRFAQQWHGHATLMPDDIVPAYFTIAAITVFAAIIFGRLPVGAGAEAQFALALAQAD